MPQTIWIARHANRLDFVNPDWFLTAPRRYDPPLSEDGFIQAQQLAKRLQGEGIAHIFVSPFLRTVQTAQAIAEVLNLSLNLEMGLSEWLNPEWMTENPERHSLEELRECYPLINSSYQSLGTAVYPETNVQMMARSAQTAQKLAAAYYPQDLLLVGHGASVVGATLGLLNKGLDVEMKASLCCLMKLVRNGEEWVMELNGDTSHLSQTETVIRFH